MFQSSCTSWSSKIIADGSTDSSQRTSGSLQVSRYRALYSSKSATSRAGTASPRGVRVPAAARRPAIRVRVAGPARRRRPGRRASAARPATGRAGCRAARRRWPRARPRPRCPAAGRRRTALPPGAGTDAVSLAASSLAARCRLACRVRLRSAILVTRQEPKAIRAGWPGLRVRSTLGGHRRLGSGQRTAPSSVTWYSCSLPGASRRSPPGRSDARPPRRSVPAGRAPRLAVPVGLDPDRRLGLADVAQHRPEHEAARRRPAGCLRLRPRLRTSLRATRYAPPGG